MTEIVVAGLTAIIGLLAWEANAMRATIGNLSMNPNFNVLTRKGMELKMRKVKSGNLSLIAWDVAGMGKANSLRGEEWVNTQIRSAMQALKAGLRKNDLLIGQLNSGDEFILVCPTEDVKGVMVKIEECFTEYRLGEGQAIYIASGPMTEVTLAENAAKVMSQVYVLKNIAKGNIMPTNNDINDSDNDGLRYWEVCPACHTPGGYCNCTLAEMDAAQDEEAIELARENARLDYIDPFAE